jgi:hypothetical protein
MPPNRVDIWEFITYMYPFKNSLEMHQLITGDFHVGQQQNAITWFDLCHGGVLYPHYPPPPPPTWRTRSPNFCLKPVWYGTSQSSQLHYLEHTNFLLNLGFLHRKHKFSLNLVWISTWKSQFYDFRYQFRAFGIRFEHFKMQKSLQGGPLPL